MTNNKIEGCMDVCMDVWMYARAQMLFKLAV